MNSTRASSGVRTGPIRWGVWGAGRIAEAVCRDMALVPHDATLHAIGARRGAQAEALRAACGAVRSHEGLAALLADPGVDAVYIATPNHRHHPDALAAVAAGKPVLVEKPFAVDARDAAEMIAAARAAGVFCMEALWTRFLPAVVEARRRVDAGALGRLVWMQSSFGYRVTPSPGAALFRADAGGGVVLDRGVYLLSLAQHLLGAATSLEGASVSGAGGVDTHGVYRLGHAGGAQSVLSASLDTALPNDLVLCGEHGTLRLPAPFYAADRIEAAAVRAFAAEASASASDGWRARLKQHAGLQALRRRLRPWQDAATCTGGHRAPYAGGGYQFQLSEVARCLRAGRMESAVMPLADTLAVQEQMDALRRQFDVALPQAAGLR